MSHNEEKVQDASPMEEKVGDEASATGTNSSTQPRTPMGRPSSPRPLLHSNLYVQPPMVPLLSATDTDIANMFSSGEEELLNQTPSLSSSAENLERALTGESIFGVNEDNESLACSVCYIALNKSNIVNTPCKHTYCWECFFKWVTTAPTCPMCRKNFVSENAWYQNRDVAQDRNDLRELVNIYQRELITLSRGFKSINKSLNRSVIKLTNVKLKTEENMRRLISSRQQISYNDGYIGGQQDVNNNIFNKKFMRQQSSLNTPWFQGYSKAQWEIRFTNRATSGAKIHTQKSVSKLNSEVEEYNMRPLFIPENKNMKNKVKNILLEEAASTPLPDDSDVE